MDTRDPLVKLGKMGVVGGQEDHIVDIFLQDEYGAKDLELEIGTV